MASELRSAAKALVEDRRETFEAPHQLGDAKARLAQALDELGAPRAVRFTGTWKVERGHDVFEASFAPTPRTRLFLKSVSLGLVLLFAASAWMLYSGPERPTARFLVLLLTALAAIGFPFVVAALGSARQAEESRIRRAIRRVLGIEPKTPRSSQ